MKWVLLILVYFSSGATDSMSHAEWQQVEFEDEYLCTQAMIKVRKWEVDKNDGHGWNRSTVFAECLKVME